MEKIKKRRADNWNEGKCAAILGRKFVLGCGVWSWNGRCEDVITEKLLFKRI